MLIVTRSQPRGRLLRRNVPLRLGKELKPARQISNQLLCRLIEECRRSRSGEAKRDTIRTQREIS